MAENACYPYARAKFWDRLPDDPAHEWLKDLVQMSMENIEKVRKVPTDITNVERIKERIQEFSAQFVGMDPGKFLEMGDAIGIKNLVDWNTLTLKSDAKAFDTAVAVNSVARGLQAMGGALQQQADSFLRAYRQNPTGAIVQAVEFGKRIREVDEMATVVMLQDLQDGRMVYAKRFRQSNPVKNSRLFEETIGAKVGQVEKLVNNVSKIDEANELLNSSNVRDRIEGLKIMKDVAIFTRNTRNPLQATAHVSNLARLGQMVWTVAMDGMLSSPATWVINATNLAYAYARPMFQYLPAKTIATVTGNANANQAAIEAVAALTEMNAAFFDGMRIAWDTIGHGGMALYGGNPDLDLLATRRLGGINADNVNEMIGQTRWLKTLGLGQYQRPLREGSVVYNSIDIAGRAIGVPNSVVTGTDDWIKHLVIRGEVARRAIKRQLNDGVDITELRDKDAIRAAIDAENPKAFGNKTISSINLGAPDFRSQWEFNTAYEHYEAIMDEAKYVTFQQDNIVSQGANAFLKKLPFLRPFMPFVRTPTNIIAQGLGDTNILGAFMKQSGLLLEEGFNPWRTLRRVNAEAMAAQASDPGMFYRQVGQLSFGTTLLGFLYMGVMDGSIVGGGPHRWLSANEDEWDVQGTWERGLRAQGKESYSWDTPLGRLKFDRFPEPFAIALRMVADFGQYASHMDEVEQDMSAATLTMMFASGLYNASFMTGLAQAMEALTDDDSAGTKKVKMGQGYLETFSPYGGLLRFIEASPGRDPYRDNFRGVGANDVYTWRGLENFWNTGLGARFASRIPGLGNQPTMIDQVLGEPMPMYPGGGPYGLNPLYAAIPVLPRGIEGDEVWNRIFQIRGKYNEATIPGVRLDPYEKAQFNRLMGNVIVGGRTFRQAIMEFSERPDVKEYMDSKLGGKIRALDVKKRTLIDTQFDMIKNQFSLAATEVMLRQNPNIAQRYQLQKQAAVASQNNDLETATKINALIEQLQRAALKAQGRPIQSQLSPEMPLLF